MFKFILAVLLLSASPTWFQEQSLAKVTFEAIDDEGNTQIRVCTGFMIHASRGLILTAAHCVPEDDRPVYVDGEESEIVKKDHDLALLKVEPFSKPALELDRDIDVGDAVTSIGFGYGDLIRLKRSIAGLSIADGKKKSNLECELLALDGPVAPGMSGGPIINAKHKVVGINQATAPAIGLGCNAKAIHSFLKEIK